MIQRKYLNRLITKRGLLLFRQMTVLFFVSAFFVIITRPAYYIITDYPSLAAMGQPENEQSFPVEIHFDGTSMTHVSDGGTVSEVLCEAGVTLGSLDKTFPRTDAYIENGRDIHILRVTRSQKLNYKTIGYDTVTVPSNELSKGEILVLQEGSPGRAATVLEVLTRDDGMEHVSPMYTFVAAAPVHKIVAEGTGPQFLVTPEGERLAYTRVMEMRSTAYTTEGRRRPENALTSTGTRPKIGTVAVDPKVIPYGTRMYITSPDGSWSYGEGVAEDTGVKGNIIDLFMNTRDECFTHGIRKTLVYILE